MAYFNKFPLLAYTANNNIDYTVVTDVTKRIVVSNEIKNNYVIYDEYDVKDGETPEVLSHKVYGSTEFHWVILLINEVIDPRYDWVLSSSALQDYVETKYGSANTSAIHHYVSSDGSGIVVDSDYTNPVNGATAVAVSNFDYEASQNENKRRIRLLKPSYLSGFVTEFEKLINA